MVCLLLPPPSLSRPLPLPLFEPSDWYCFLLKSNNGKRETTQTKRSSAQHESKGLTISSSVVRSGTYKIIKVSNFTSFRRRRSRGRLRGNFLCGRKIPSFSFREVPRIALCAACGTGSGTVPRECDMAAVCALSAMYDVIDGASEKRFCASSNRGGVRLYDYR